MVTMPVIRSRSVPPWPFVLRGGSAILNPSSTTGSPVPPPMATTRRSVPSRLAAQEPNLGSMRADPTDSDGAIEHLDIQKAVVSEPSDHFGVEELPLILR